MDEGNTTRRATDEELEQDLGIVKCEQEDCADVLVPRGFAAIKIPPTTASEELRLARGMQLHMQRTPDCMQSISRAGIGQRHRCLKQQQRLCRS